MHAGGLGGTYGGNPVACAAALAAIATMREHDLNAAARAIEAMMTAPAAPRWPAGHPAIGDVRGRGAMLAIELVKPGTAGARRRARRADREGLPRKPASSCSPAAPTATCCGCCRRW